MVYAGSNLTDLYQVSARIVKHRDRCGSGFRWRALKFDPLAFEPFVLRLDVIDEKACQRDACFMQGLLEYGGRGISVGFEH